MLIENLKTTYFRGRGGQRIRRVILLTTDALDSYATGVGFIDGNDPGTVAPSISDIIRGRIRDFTVRTIEPRVHTDIAFPGAQGDAISILDFLTISENTIGGAQRVHILCFNVEVGAGIAESGPIIADDLASDIEIPFEIEYTSHSGAEG